MAIQEINVSTGPNTGNGDPIRAAFVKINQNFSSQQHAASRMAGTQAGNVMEVGAFGFGGNGRYVSQNPANQAPVSDLDRTQMYTFNDTGVVDYGSGLGWVAANKVHFIIGGRFNGQLHHVVVADKNAETRSAGYHVIRTAQNTTVDANGFIKNASPIAKLFADKIELNDEAQQQNITFEKLGVGDYLIKGSRGFAQEGWYIETPKDANGNLLVAVVYEQLENGDISVKTYDYMLNNKGRIVADTETPLDIPETRWIDLRLQELPQPEIEIPEPIAPPDFQPTGLAQAVATVMESYNDTEQ
ncbi:phage tail protein [Acinetobacter radioresistens]|uniref:phage tail fiber protein n=1 Tax=Acinetobacter radioresistens TaxID=40216 RepID=UPI003A7FE059